MRNIFLIILVSLLYSCYDSNTKVQELKELNDRVRYLEQKMDSLTHIKSTGMGIIGLTSRCAGITKKGTSCRSKAKSNGYCWQHGG